jgi:opacity protein-like surface antigen
MKNFLALLIILLTFASERTFAQTHCGVSFTLGFPYNDFRQNTDAVGAGLNINALFPIFKNSPLFVGFDFGYQVYGYRSYRRNLDAQIVANGQVIGTIPMNFKISNTNNLLNGHLVMRLKAPLKYVQPYVDGLVGFKNLYTRTTIEDLTNNSYYNNNNNNNNTNESNIINSRTNLADWAFSYGYGGGLMFSLSENVSLDAKVIFLQGGEARYFDKESTANWDIRFVQGNSGTLEPVNAAVMGIKYSRTDMIFGQIGLTFHFR